MALIAKNRRSIVRARSPYLTAISKTVSAGGYAPHIDYYEAFDGVVQAVENGVIPESRIDESVYRILSFKYGRQRTK